MYQRILVTGGAGFVGSSLAVFLKRHHPEAAIVAMDNLHRRGSELTLSRLRAEGVEFLHGDIRFPEDIETAGKVDLVVECSAEPSAQAGYKGSPAYLLSTNLNGTINCLEHVRRTGADLVFLSTSRVYPIPALAGLPLERVGDRLVLPAGASGPGWSEAGIAEEFPLAGRRTLYGATKLAVELLIEEYRAAYGVRAIVNRCGVLTGPWQMGKIDQGVIVLWLARHLFGRDLSYIGYGGEGIQVRDLLHVEDLYDLLMLQLADIERHDGVVYNVGGGNEVSVSLRELTRHCRDITGNKVGIRPVPETAPTDVPYYVTDSARVTAATGWRPEHSLPDTLDEIYRWIRDNRAALEPILNP